VLESKPGGDVPLMLGPPASDNWSLRRYEGGWLAVVSSFLTGYMKLFYSAAPQGPWKFLYLLRNPETGGQRWGADIYTYGVHWHPEMDVAEDQLMLSYNAQPVGETTYGTEDTDFYFQNMHYRVVPIRREIVF
jgi:hypothetical protein